MAEAVDGCGCTESCFELRLLFCDKSGGPQAAASFFVGATSVAIAFAPAQTRASRLKSLPQVRGTLAGIASAAINEATYPQDEDYYQRNTHPNTDSPLDGLPVLRALDFR